MDKLMLSRRDRLWLAGLALLFVLWVGLLGAVVASLWLPGHPLGGPPVYSIPAGYHLVPNVYPTPVLR